MLQVICFLFICTSALLLLVRLCGKSKSPNHNFPPGPPKLPFIGNLHQIGLLPHHSLTTLAKTYGPVMHLQLGELSAVVVSSAEAIKEVLKTNDLSFAQRPRALAAAILDSGNSGIFFAPYGDYWTLLRKVCTQELLNAKRVQSLATIREDEVGNLTRFISSQDGVPVNLCKCLSAMANNVASRAALGEKCQDGDKFMSLLSRIIVLGGGYSLADLFPSIGFLQYITGMKPALVRIQKKLDKILDNIINEHKERKSAAVHNAESSHNNLLNVLLDLQESDCPEMHLTMDQIKILITEIVFAATDTTTSTMIWAMSELVRNPDVMEKAQNEVREAFKGRIKIEESEIQDLHYLKSVIRETLRLHPAITITTREAREKCEIGGYQIPMTAAVYVNIWGLGRDSTIWIDPDSFKPERFQNSSFDFKGTNFNMIPFGGGRRICPGMSFATPSIGLALAHLLYHFDWKLPHATRAEELDMSELFGMTVRRKHDLWLTATARVPLGN